MHGNSTKVRARSNNLQLGEDDYLAGGEPSEHDEERTKWEEAEQRLEEIRSRRGLPPLPGEVAESNVELKIEDMILQVYRKARAWRNDPETHELGRPESR